MRIRIHHGAHEIGGNCVEVEANDGSRILLDLGRPLSAAPWDVVPLPDVAGLTTADPHLLAVLISHPHLDHYGLVDDLLVNVPIYIGREAAAILAAAAFFSPITKALTPTGFLCDRAPFVLGPFTITPYLADHSAFDSYSLLIEVDGKRIFYTGDFRGHGRKAALFDRLLADPPAAIDVLLCEGTSVRTDGTGDVAIFPTESQLEDDLVTLNRQTAGCVAMLGSAQSLDRIVTAFRAARRSGRVLVVDLYAATVAAATRPTIPQPGFDGLRVFVPQRQDALVTTSGQVHRIETISEHRIFPEELAANPGCFLLHVPSSTVDELITQGVLDPTGQVLWSMWDGYLTEPSGVRLTSDLAHGGVPFWLLHTSGHASVPDLRRLIDALAPKQVVPIHTEASARFGDLFNDVSTHADGSWWAA